MLPAVFCHYLAFAFLPSCTVPACMHHCFCLADSSMYFYMLCMLLCVCLCFACFDWSLKMQHNVFLFTLIPLIFILHVLYYETLCCMYKLVLPVLNNVLFNINILFSVMLCMLIWDLNNFKFSLISFFRLTL